MASDYPHNSPYAFSENRVIDGVELEGLEVVVLNKENSTVNFVANIYFVGEGEGKVPYHPKLEKAIESRIVNQLDDEQRTILGYTYNFSLNYISEDEDGNPLTFEKAKELNQNSSITYKSPVSDKEITVSGPKTGVVVASSTVYEGKEMNRETNGLFVSDGREGKHLNTLYLNTNNLKLGKIDKVLSTFAHEVGHFLGRRAAPDGKNHAKGFQSTGEGITSNDPTGVNIKLVPDDLQKMFVGAKQRGTVLKL